VSSQQSSYKHHLLQKRALIQSLLGKIDCDHINPEIIPTPIGKGYRNRAKYKIFGNPEGFQVKGTDPTHGEVPYQKAIWLLPSWGRKLVTQIVEIISDRVLDYWVDGFEVQLSHGKRHAHVTLSVKRQDKQSYSGLAEILLAEISSLEGVSIPSKKQDFGKSYLLHSIHGVDFLSQYSVFFQSNLCLTAKLVEEVKRQCQNWNFHRILDLYCGVGLFSLSLAEKTITAIGVDINKRAIDSARFNAKNMQFHKVSFLCCPVENFLKNALISSNDLVIIDPPRSGCPESLIAIISERKPRCICSISCDLPTHIRDLKSWMRNGYKVQSMAAFDMFPFTEYLETAAFLSRNI
jgi:tRNA/tmRNA/rRNA uracil-C5-methylase (TrmA/RlmC/RlmD family)